MKSTKSLQDLLFKELESISSGKGDLKKAKVVSKISSQIIYSTRLELENKRIELEIAKSSEEVKEYVKKDFSNIQSIKIGSIKWVEKHQRD